MSYATKSFVCLLSELSVSEHRKKGFAKAIETEPTDVNMKWYAYHDLKVQCITYELERRVLLIDIDALMHRIHTCEPFKLTRHA
jgi:hypothetical protein